MYWKVVVEMSFYRMDHMNILKFMIYLQTLTPITYFLIGPGTQTLSPHCF